MRQPRIPYVGALERQCQVAGRGASVVQGGERGKDGKVGKEQYICGDHPTGPAEVGGRPRHEGGGEYG